MDKVMLELDMFSEMDKEDNPTFLCEEKDLKNQLEFLFTSGYNVIIHNNNK